MQKNELVLFVARDHSISLLVAMDSEAVWLSANQMAVLFDCDEKTIRKHISNVLMEKVDERNNTQKMRVDGIEQAVPFYSLDVIISVGYRVRSRRGVEFRCWANTVLKEYIIKGYTINNNRVEQLGEVIKVMKRVETQLDEMDTMVKIIMNCLAG